MKKTIIEETIDIFQKLLPANQIYFMTLVKLAEAVENSVKNEFSSHTKNF